MAKPSALPTWATDTNFSSGPESGTPVKVEPSAGAKAQGWVPGQPWRGPRMNWWQELVHQWTVYLNLSGTDELTYANTRTRTVMVSPLPGAITTTAATPGPQPDDRGWLGSDDGAMTSDGPDTQLRIPLPVPQGATLTQVRAGVTGSGSGLDMKVFRRTSVKTDGSTHTGTTTQLGSTQTATTTGKLLVVSGLTEAASDTNMMLVTFDSNSGGDQVWWVEVTYTETRATGHF